MDSLSQVVLGASIAQLTLGPIIGRRALLVGAALGTLPDLDVLVPYDDAIASFTYHRSWSHSLFVLSLLSVPLAWMCKQLFRASTANYSTWWLGVWLVLITHPLLDGFTVYGTQIWWPLRVTPTAWDSVFIIDPLYTLPLIVGVVAAWRWRGKRSTPYVVGGLLISSLYLGWTLYAQHLTRQKVNETLAAQNIEASRILVAPLPLSLLWRIVVVTDEHYFEGFSSLLDDTRDIKLDRYTNGKSLCSDWLNQWPVDRLNWFTRGAYSLSVQGDSLVATDLRMGIEDSFVFEFNIAQWQDDQWQKIITEQRPIEIDGDRMKLLLHRVYDESISLTPSVAPIAVNNRAASGNESNQENDNALVVCRPHTTGV